MPTKDAPAKESGKALVAKQDYLTMGKDRSMTRLAAGDGASGVPWSMDSLKRWSAAFGWVEAAREWDRGTARKRMEAAQVAAAEERDKSRRKRLDRSAQIGEIVDTWLRLKGDDRMIAKMSPYAIVQLAQFAAETERLDHGEATARTEMLGEGAVFRIIREERVAPPLPLQTSVVEHPPIEAEVRLLPNE